MSELAGGAALRSQREIREFVGSELELPVEFIYWRDKTDEGRCRMCRRPSQVRQLTRHHVVPKAWFKWHVGLEVLRNVAPNIVPLCRPCHDEVEGGGYARTLFRRVLAPDEVTFAVRVAGEWWFARYYPPAGILA